MEKLYLVVLVLLICYINSDWKVCLASFTLNKNENYCMYVIRLNSDGGIDREFGSNLKRDINGDRKSDNTVIVNSLSNCFIQQIAQDWNKNLYIAANSFSTRYNYDICIVKLKPNRKLDITFGNKGIVRLDNIVNEERKNKIGYDNFVYDICYDRYFPNKIYI